MTDKSLVQKAKSFPANHRQWTTPRERDIELALAWVDDEVSLSQCIKAWNTQRVSVYVKLAYSLREHLRNGHKGK